MTTRPRHLWRFKSGPRKSPSTTCNVIPPSHHLRQPRARSLTPKSAPSCPSTPKTAVLARTEHLPRKSPNISPFPSPKSVCTPPPFSPLRCQSSAHGEGLCGYSGYRGDRTTRTVDVGSVPLEHLGAVMKLEIPHSVAGQAWAGESGRRGSEEWSDKGCDGSTPHERMAGIMPLNPTQPPRPSTLDTTPRAYRMVLSSDAVMRRSPARRTT